MANYETLADGGHEHLIATVKPLVDQKANEHDIDVSVKELVENQPRGQLTGEILTTSHAYDMPPVSVIVDGRSTQVTTTGKNLLSDVDSDWVSRSISGLSGSIASFAIPIEDGQKYIYVNEHGVGLTRGLYGAFCDTLTGTIAVTGRVTLTNYDSMVFSNTDNHAYLIFYATSRNTEASAIAYMLKAKHVYVMDGDTPTGYEPYSGCVASPSPTWPQPIASVEPSLIVAGRNMLDPSAIEQGSLYPTSGADADNAATCRSEHYLPVVPNSSVTVTGESSTGTLQYSLVWFRDYNGINAYTGRYASGQSVSVPSSPSGIDSCRVLFNNSDASAITPTDLTNIQFEICSTATAYEPYSGTTVQLPVTLRSLPDGTKDTLTLSYLRPSTREGWAWYTPTMVKRIDEIHFNNANTITAASSSGHKILNKTLQGLYESTYTSYYKNNYVSNRFVGTTRAANYMLVGEGAYNGGSTHKAYICVDENVIPDLATGNAWLEGNPTYIYLKFLEPITIQLDPIELPHMPLGDVTIWSDPTTGLTVNYIVEGKAIEATLETGIANALAAIATVETSPTTYNHAVGSRIVYNEVLYRVTSAIASGEDIVPGTNVEATTVTDEIKRLQQ